MTDTPEVHQVYIHIKPVSPALPTGQIAYGFYVIKDDLPLIGKKKDAPPAGFGWPLNYPKSGVY